MNDAVKKEDASDGEKRHSSEEKFFGVSQPVSRPSKEKKAAEEMSNVEIVDDNDSDDKGKDESELDSYSERVQKRIDKLTYEAREAQRQAEKLQQERDEAFRATHVLHQQKQQYENIIANGEKELVARIKQGADAAVETAKAAYRKAYEEGDTEEVIAAQEKLIQAQAEKKSAEAYEQDYQARLAAYQSQFQNYQQPQQYHEANAGVQQRQPQPQPKIPEPDPETKQWAEQNPWFGDPKHRDMSAVALATHETLIRDQGIKPNTPEYFQEIDKTMRRRFPEYFETTRKASASSSQSSPVAPAGRETSGTPRKVRLTPSQAALAKRLGLTPDQYAKELLKQEGLSR